MLETNEEYMSQEKLDSILSETHEYVPSQKELDTKVLYDDYYVYLIGSLLMTILMASTGQNTDKKYGYEKPMSFKMSFIAEARNDINNINSIKGRPVKKNPNLRDLNMGDYNKDIYSIQRKLKLLKRQGGCADFMKPFFKEFVELYKSLPKPILL
ncbi:hypothetical protein [Treponema saccharophilum]|uniref:hypothetical protein n=1 Tax=Treponema saccharophilum TaxID=165 RepID=UPI003869697E